MLTYLIKLSSGNRLNIILIIILNNFNIIKLFICNYELKSISFLFFLLNNLILLYKGYFIRYKHVIIAFLCAPSISTI